MFTILDGRESFYQWDSDRQLIVADTTIKQVHFCNKTDDCSLVCETYLQDGLTVVNVPNVLLQDNWRINVYAYDGKYTKHSATFGVIPRSKPEDYVYTETEVKRWADIEARVDEIEKQGISAEKIAKAVEDYLEENPVEVDIDLSGYATEEFVNNAIENAGGGLSPTAKVTQTTTGAIITITDVNGTTEATIENGTPYTLTEVDKGIIVEEVIAELPIYNLEVEQYE